MTQCCSGSNTYRIIWLLWNRVKVQKSVCTTLDAMEVPGTPISILHRFLLYVCYVTLLLPHWAASPKLGVFSIQLSPMVMRNMEWFPQLLWNILKSESLSQEMRPHCYFLILPHSYWYNSNTLINLLSDCYGNIALPFHWKRTKSHNITIVI